MPTAYNEDIILFISSLVFHTKEEVIFEFSVFCYCLSLNKNQLEKTCISKHYFPTTNNAEDYQRAGVRYSSRTSLKIKVFIKIKVFCQKIVLSFNIWQRHFSMIGTLSYFLDN